LIDRIETPEIRNHLKRKTSMIASSRNHQDKQSSVDPVPNEPSSLSMAVSSWEENGAHLQFPLPLGDDDERILGLLGAAVILQWNSLSAYIQWRPFARAWTADFEAHAVPLNERIARSLHDHKNDASEAIRDGLSLLALRPSRSF
jgi:hypothetical protein